MNRLIHSFVLTIVFIAITPLGWFGWRNKKLEARLRQRLVAVVSFEGDAYPTTLHFYGEAAKAIRQQMALGDLAFMFAVDDRAAQGIDPTPDERARYEAIINTTAHAWLTTEAGERWLAENLR